MITYTTPAITLEVENIDITNKDVRVTIQQGTYKLTKSGNDLSITLEIIGSSVINTVITLVLTQAESGKFRYDAPASIQVNWIDERGVRDATEPATVDVMRNLLDEVIEYGN